MSRFQINFVLKASVRVFFTVAVQLLGIFPGIAQWSPDSVPTQWTPMSIEMVREYNGNWQPDVEPDFWSRYEELKQGVVSGMQSEGYGIPYRQGAWDGIKALARAKGNPYAKYTGVQMSFARVNEATFFSQSEPHGEFPIGHLFHNGPKLLVPGHRPTIIYFPGIFQGVKDFYTYQAIRMFHKRGYNVIVLPSPFSEEYCRELPRASAGHFVEEGRLAYKAIAKIRRDHQQYISEIHLVGVSYGAFLAAVVKAIDAESRHPFISGLTMIGPVIEISETVEILDKMIKSSQLNISSFDNLNVPSPFKSLIASAFQKKLSDVRMNFRARYERNKANNFGGSRYYSPEERENFEKFPMIGKKPDADFIASTYFAKTIRENAKDIEDLVWGKNNIDRIDFWLKKIARKGDHRVRILTTWDDYVINSQRWKDVLPEEFKSEEHFLMRGSGGHNGFIMTEWFDEFVTTAFPPVLR